MIVATTGGVAARLPCPTGPALVDQLLTTVPTGPEVWKPVGIKPRFVSIATDALIDNDRGQIVSYSNSGNTAVSIAQAGSTGFDSGYFVCIQNDGIGSVTITPDTSSIAGGPNFTLTALQGTCIFSNETDYFIRSTLNVANVNCTSTAAPAACGSANIGAVTVAAAATTKVVNTTAVGPNSRIEVQFDSGLGANLAVTCDTMISPPLVTARVTGVSFTITLTVPPDGIACYSYSIRN